MRPVAVFLAVALAVPLAAATSIDPHVGVLESRESCTSSSSQATMQVANGWQTERNRSSRCEDASDDADASLAVDGSSVAGAEEGSHGQNAETDHSTQTSTSDGSGYASDDAGSSSTADGVHAWGPAGDVSIDRSWCFSNWQSESSSWSSPDGSSFQGASSSRSHCDRGLRVTGAGQEQTIQTGTCDDAGTNSIATGTPRVTTVHQECHTAIVRGFVLAGTETPADGTRAEASSGQDEQDDTTCGATADTCRDAGFDQVWVEGLVVLPLVGGPDARFTQPLPVFIALV